MLIAVLAGVVAIAAAIRSTWSPCGQSMLSTITPLGEAGRGNRFRTTASWFILGATLGGAVLGLGAALLAAIVGAAGLSANGALAVAAALAAISAIADAGLFGLHVPYHRRQVNELWLDDYRPWVYGGGFGFQIGLGFATYIMTSALVLLVALAALTGEPLVALGLGTLFGFARGLGVLPGARLTNPIKLAEFHRVFDARSAQSRRLVIAAQLFVAVAAAIAVGGGAAGLGAAALLGLLFAASARRRVTVTEAAPTSADARDLVAP
jgi:hypothetical protein